MTSEALNVAPVFNFQYNYAGPPLVEAADIAQVMGLGEECVQATASKHHSHATLSAEMGAVDVSTTEKYTAGRIINALKRYSHSEGTIRATIDDPRLFALIVYTDKARSAAQHPTYLSSSLRMHVDVPADKKYDPAFTKRLDTVAFERRQRAHRHNERTDLTIDGVPQFSTPGFLIETPSSTPLLDAISRQQHILAAIFGGVKAEETVRLTYGDRTSELAQLHQEAMRQKTPLNAATYVLGQLVHEPRYAHRA